MAKARANARRQRPDVKARAKVAYQKYHKRPEVIERLKRARALNPRVIELERQRNVTKLKWKAFLKK